MKNLGDMMKQVQAMQSRMADVQAKLEAATVTGQSGGGLVSVTLNGKGTMTAIAIDASLFKPEEGSAPCELCGKPMLVRFSDGRKFYGCSGYPECKGTRGGGGGSPTLGQAGGKDADGLDEALAEARRWIESKLT